MSGARPMVRFMAIGVLVALVLAGGVSAFASSSPDGLDSVTRQGCTFGADDEITGGHCLAQQARAHGLETSPFAGYEARGVSGAGSTALSGVLGVLVTLGVAWGLAVLLRRPGPQRPDAAVSTPGGGLGTGSSPAR